jgi:hypothetical protein
VINSNISFWLSKAVYFVQAVQSVQSVLTVQSGGDTPYKEIVIYDN